MQCAHCPVGSLCYACQTYFNVGRMFPWFSVWMPTTKDIVRGGADAISVGAAFASGARALAPLVGSRLRPVFACVGKGQSCESAGCERDKRYSCRAISHRVRAADAAGANAESHGGGWGNVHWQHCR